jgi:hypothetical protein
MAAAVLTPFYRSRVVELGNRPPGSGLFYRPAFATAYSA